MLIQTVFLDKDGQRVLWDTESESYLVKLKTPYISKNPKCVCGDTKKCPYCN